MQVLGEAHLDPGKSVLESVETSVHSIKPRVHPVAERVEPSVDLGVQPEQGSAEQSKRAESHRQESGVPHDAHAAMMRHPLRLVERD